MKSLCTVALIVAATLANVVLIGCEGPAKPPSDRSAPGTRPAPAPAPEPLAPEPTPEPSPADQQVTHTHPATGPGGTPVTHTHANPDHVHIWRHSHTCPSGTCWHEHTYANESHPADGHPPPTPLPSPPPFGFPGDPDPETNLPTVTYQATAGEAFTATIPAARNAEGTVSYALTLYPALWLTLNDRVLSGTPPVACTTEFGVRAVDGPAPDRRRSELWVIIIVSEGTEHCHYGGFGKDGIKLYNLDLVGEVGVAGSWTLPEVDVAPSVAYRPIVADGRIFYYRIVPRLPSWLTFDETTRVLSGTPPSAATVRLKYFVLINNHGLHSQSCVGCPGPGPNDGCHILDLLDVHLTASE